jgi:hypothetical protein
MAIQRFNYEATCDGCGKQGVMIRHEHENGSQDDLLWVGFLLAKGMSVAAVAWCACGSEDIKVGKLTSFLVIPELAAEPA